MSVIATADQAAPPVAARSAPLSSALLADIATGLAETEELWRPHAHHDPAKRQPVRLVVCDLWEAWVVGWTPGQHVELHDHGDSAGVLLVVEGDLVEVLPARPHRLLRTWQTGEVATLPVGIVHDVVGLGPGVATSIHVYSPPLGAMTYYDDDGQPLRTDEPEDHEAVNDLRNASRALHPSSRRG